MVLTLGPLSAIIGTIPGYFLSDRTVAGAGVGALIGFLIAAGMVAFEVSWWVGIIGQRIREASFVSVLMTQSLTWLLIIVVGISLPMVVVGSVLPGELLATPFLVSVGISFAIATIVNFIIQLNQLLGRGVLLRFIAGRNHTPHEEDRIFLFVDLRSSTHRSHMIATRPRTGSLIRGQETRIVRGAR